MPKSASSHHRKSPSHSFDHNQVSDVRSKTSTFDPTMPSNFQNTTANEMPDQFADSIESPNKPSTQSKAVADELESPQLNPADTNSSPAGNVGSTGVEFVEAEIVPATVVSNEVSNNEAADLLPQSVGESRKGPIRRTIGWTWRICKAIVVRIFEFACLVVMLGIASSLPIIQLAGLGYLLEVGRRIADNNPNESKLPGLKKAGRLGVVSFWIFVTWLPVWFVADLAYSERLISPNSLNSIIWSVVATGVTIGWITNSIWALLRGGRWYHFIWPAPIRFLKEIWRPSTWKAAEDALWEYTVGLRLGQLAWLGLRGGAAALLWVALPGLLVAGGMEANDRPGLILVGFIGALLMSIVLLYLPFLQIQMAQANRFRAAFDVRRVRETFKRAPIAFFVSLFVTLLLAIPLYLFRIESLPTEVLWAPCLVFVLFGLPAKSLIGWSLRRGQRERPRRHWFFRYVSWGMQLAIVPIYMFFMYIATLASWEGVGIVFFQHAFLVPVPLAGN